MTMKDAGLNGSRVTRADRRLSPSCRGSRFWTHLCFEGTDWTHLQEFERRSWLRKYLPL